MSPPPGTHKRTARCAEKMQFIVGMYCMGASGATESTRMRGRRLGPAVSVLPTRLMTACTHGAVGWWGCGGQVRGVGRALRQRAAQRLEAQWRGTAHNVQHMATDSADASDPSAEHVNPSRRGPALVST